MFLSEDFSTPGERETIRMLQMSGALTADGQLTNTF
jgi:hypothetical protein